MINLHLEGKSPLKANQLDAIVNSINNSIKIGRNYDIGLSFVDTETIQELNERYAGNNYPTDVLSFEYDDSTSESDGDIAVCSEIAESQSKENKISFEAELSLLVVHGVLHILGYDHQDKVQIASLDAIQGDIMKRLNYEYRDFKWSH